MLIIEALFCNSSSPGTTQDPTIITTAAILQLGSCSTHPYLHAQADGVQCDQEEHKVLKVGAGHNIPYLVLVGVLGNVASQRACFECILHTLALEREEIQGGNGARQGLPYFRFSCSLSQHYVPYLVLVQLTVFVLCFTLLLEGYDDKTYKDVHHEKGYEDEIDDEVDGNAHAIVVDGAHVLSACVNCFVQ